MVARRSPPDVDDRAEVLASAERAVRRERAARSRAGRVAEARRPGRHVGRHRRGGRALPLWQELPLLLLIAFSLALLLKTFVVQAFFIPSGSMEETLRIRDRVLVNKVVYDLREPRRGEVVVFRGTDSWAPEATLPPDDGALASAGRWLGGLVGLGQPNEKDFIKRVVGVGGDVVRCCDSRGRVTVNGEPLDEPYVFENNPSDQRAFGQVTVPAGRLFVMGDHRGLSQDSRAYLGDRWRGSIPVDQVIGRAFVTVWPVDHWRGLATPATFEAVPKPRALGPPGVEPPGVVPARVEPVLEDVGSAVLPFVLLLRRRRRRVDRARPRSPALTP